ncbi:protein phosphatase 1 regulatory subunit 35 isoform 2-T2 [Spinachia spinachia]
MSSSSLSPPPSPPPAPFPLLSSCPLDHCPELDLSVTLSAAPKTGQTHLKPSPPKNGRQSEQPRTKPRPQGQTGRQVFFRQPPNVKVTLEQNTDAPPKQPNRGPGRSREYAPTQWAESSGAGSNQVPGFLNKMELNSTLALKAELQSLQGAEFNSQKAIRETLRRSERTKTLINTRATEEVNVSRSQLLFTSLVEVEVQEDELVSQVLQNRLPLPCNGNKATDGPSLLLFMNSDHLREKPVPLKEEPVNCKPRPAPCPADSAFDLHRRGRC